MWTPAAFGETRTSEELENGTHTLAYNQECDVFAVDHNLSSKIWFTSPVSRIVTTISLMFLCSRIFQAIDQHTVARIDELQLFTDSHDQGFVNFREAGSWSWFDIVILASPDATEPKIKNGRSLVWLSHSNELGEEDFTEKKGDSFKRGHELFSLLEVCFTLARYSNRADQSISTFRRAMLLGYESAPNFLPGKIMLVVAALFCRFPTVRSRNA